MLSKQVWLVAVLVAANAFGADLESAHVEIDLGAEVIHVAASYRLTGEEDVRFRLRHFAGQELRLLSTAHELHEAVALTYFDARPDTGDVVVLYEVRRARKRSARERIPLFVPDTAARGAIEIRLRGAGHDLALRDGFPRLQPTAGAELLARPANLPSFVRLPPPRGRWTVHRVAESTVVLLVVVATALWILRLRR